jgi:hypothetical protein
MMINDYIYKMIYDLEKKQDEYIAIHGYSVKSLKTASSRKSR